MKVKNPFFFIIAIYIVLIIFIFRTWFTLSPLTGGDWEYLYPGAMRDLSLIPSSWNMMFGNGFGGNQTFFMVPNSFFTTSSGILYQYVGMTWEMIERVVWFYPYLIISSFSAYFLFRIIFKKDYVFSLISSFIYVCNSYALMIVGGGQMGVAMGYAFSPLVLAFFIRLAQEKKKR